MCMQSVLQKLRIIKPNQQHFRILMISAEF